MTQTYAEARAAQLHWLLPHMHAEHARLEAVKSSQLTGQDLNAHSCKILCRQANKIKADIEGLR